MNKTEVIEIGKQKKGRPSLKTENYKPTNFWTGDKFCINLMTILGEQCTFQFKYATGIRAIYDKDNQEQKQTQTVETYNQVKDEILKILNMDATNKSVILRQINQNQKDSAQDSDQQNLQFKLSTDRGNLLKVAKMMDKIKMLIDPNCLTCFQQFMEVYTAEKEKLNLNEYRQDTKNRVLDQCIGMIKENPAKYKDFLNLEVIKKFISVKTVSSKREKIDRKIKEKIEKLTNLSKSDQEICLSDLQDELLIQCTKIRKLLQAIFEVWDDCATQQSNQSNQE